MALCALKAIKQPFQYHFIHPLIYPLNSNHISSSARLKISEKQSEPNFFLCLIFGLICPCLWPSRPTLSSRRKKADPRLYGVRTRPRHTLKPGPSRQTIHARVKEWDEQEGGRKEGSCWQLLRNTLCPPQNWNMEGKISFVNMREFESNHEMYMLFFLQFICWPEINNRRIET